MLNFFQQLSREHRDLFTELMAVRDANGGLLATADEAATDLLKAFVTEHGQLDAQIATRLGGQPAYGRADVVLDLVRALTGPYPIAQAWLDAQRHGGFDLFAPEYYHARSAASRSLGSPGVYLQRMVAQYRSDANNRRASPANNVALYTETALLTGVMVVKTLQKAVCAKSALGPAWVVNTAVDPLSNETKRQMDALASNKAYIEALGEAIASVTAAHVTPNLAERTNDEVEHSLPANTNVGAFFAEHDARRLTMATDLLIEAVERRSDTTSDAKDSTEIEKLVDRLIAAVDKIEIGQEKLLDARVAAATAYLYEPIEMIEDKKEEHYERLRFLMPDLINIRSPEERAVKLLQTSNIYLYYNFLGVAYVDNDLGMDKFFKAIINKINSFAINVGPPPINTPIEHIAYFESAVNAIIASKYPFWNAREAWQAAGLVPELDHYFTEINQTIALSAGKDISSINVMHIKKQYIT